MAKIEREYNIPLRQEYLKAPMYRRSKKAITAIKEFLVKHMKSEDIKLGVQLNDKIWEHGIKNPPHHILVTVTKNEDGTVFADLKETVEKKKSFAEKVNEKGKRKLSSVKKETVESKVAESSKDVKKTEVKETKAKNAEVKETKVVDSETDSE